MALSYINNKEIKFGSAKPLNGVYTPGSPTREYEPLDSLGIYLNSGIPLSYGVENGRYMSMSDEFVATSQGNSYSFNQLFAAQMMLGFKLHDRFIACDTEHKIIGTEPLLHKAYLAEITEKTLDYFKIKIYGDKTRTFCIRMSSSEVPTSYVDLTNSFDENGLNLTQTDRQSFLSYYRFYPLTARDPSSRAEETLGVDYYLLPSAEGLKELSGDILSKFNAFISSDGSTLTSLGNTAFAYAGDIDYVPNYRDEAMSTEIGTVREDLNQLKGDITDIQNTIGQAEETCGTALDVMDFDTIASMAKVRIAGIGSTKEGVLKSITVRSRLDGGSIAFYFINGSTGEIVEKVICNTVLGKNVLVNGVDFVSSVKLPVNCYIGVFPTDTGIYYKANTEKSWNANFSTGNVGDITSFRSSADGFTYNIGVSFDVVSSDITNMKNDITGLKKDVSELQKTIKQSINRCMIDEHFDTDITSEWDNSQGAFTWTKGVGAVSKNKGWQYRLRSTKLGDFNNRLMRVRFTANDLNTVVAIGNISDGNSLYAYSFYIADLNAKKLQVIANWNGESANIPTPIISENITIPVTANTDYILEFHRDNLCSVKVIFRNCTTGDYQEITNNTNTFKGFLYPCVIPVNGNFTVREIVYKHMDKKKCKLAVYGDSFIEGSSLGYENMGKQYTELLGEYIKEKPFTVCRGGMDVNQGVNEFNSNYLCNSEYVLIALGTNETSAYLCKTRLQNFINAVEEKGSKPILVTVSRRGDTDNLALIQEVNEWARNSGYPYIDVAKAISLNNDGVTVNPNLYYSDNVHPNVDGHMAIFNRALIDIADILEE